MSERIIIVGAGLAGCSVAWHLRHSAELCLLDQATTPGAEAAGQNAGMLRRLGEDPYERKLAQRSHLFLQNPGPDWDGLQPATRTGALMLCAQDPHHFEDAVSHLQAIGASIDTPDTLAEYEWILGKRAFERAVYLPDELTCRPKDLIEGFLRGLHTHTHTLHLDTRVERLLINEGRVQGVQTSQGPVWADKVVLAAGAWSGKIAKTAGLIRPLTPLRRSIFVTEPVFSPDNPSPWIWVDDVGIYARPMDGRLMVSPCDERVDRVEHDSSWGQTESWQAALLERKTETYFPGLNLKRIQKSWTGLRTFAPDRRPLVGEDPDLPGLWWAAGLGGFGVSCAIGVGEALSAWMQEQTVDWLDPRMVSPGRPMASKWLMRPKGHIHDGRLIPAGI